MAATPQETPLLTGQSRLWVIVGGAGAGREPVLLPAARAGTLRWPGAAGRKLEIPDPNVHDEFRVVTTVRPPAQYPTITAVNRKGDRPSLFLALRRQQCPATIQIHYGDCGPAADYDHGWSTIMTIIEGAVATDYSTGEQGAVESGQRGAIDETITFEGSLAFDLGRVAFGVRASSVSTKPYIGVVVCDTQVCAGLCGSGSDGCQVVFAVTQPLGGSPSAYPGVSFTADDWATEDQSYVDVLGTNVPTGIACAGRDLLVISEAAEALAWASIADILASDEAWTLVGTGFVAGHGPRAVFAYAPNQIYFAGAGGYVYSSSAIEDGVSIDDSGDTTTEDLNAVHTPDGRIILIGGDNDALILSTDGGQSYTLLNGPGSGGAITAVMAVTATELFAGTDTHQLFHTVNGGITWSEINFPGHGTGDQISRLLLSPGQNSVGYMVDSGVGGKGRVLRTYNGGRTWIAVPESETQTLPNNAGFSDLAVCADPNRVYAVGTATGGSAGVLLRGSAV